jgi:multimeric flavodoxin WrbA
MPNILILSGSPIEGGSTDILLNEVARGIVEEASSPAEVEFVRLNDYQFVPCQACGKSPEPDYCFFHDAIYPFYDKLINCEIVLFGSPVYFDSVSAQSKAFIDRCNCLRPPNFDNYNGFPFKKIIGKKRLGGMVIVGGHRGEFECARKVIAGFFKWAEIIDCGMATFEGKTFDKGEAGKDSAALSEARRLGIKIAEKWRGSCP